MSLFYRQEIVKLIVPAVVNSELLVITIMVAYLFDVVTCTAKWCHRKIHAKLPSPCYLMSIIGECNAH